MKDKLLSFLVLPSIMFALFLAFSPVGRVEAIVAVGEGWQDTSACVASVCGTTEGTKTQDYYSEVCDKDCPEVTFTANRQVVDVPAHWGNCPLLYEVDPQHQNKCIFKDWRYASRTGGGNCPANDNAYTSRDSSLPCSRKVVITAMTMNRPWIPDTYKTETFSVTFKYDKAPADRNHCHKPTPESLNIPSWARGEYGSLVTELGSVDTNCRFEVTDTRTISCSNATPFECVPVRGDFNLTSMCKPSDTEGGLRVRNQSDNNYHYILRWVGTGTSIAGMAPANEDTLVVVPWTASNNTWILEIAGFSFTKAIGNNALCNPYVQCSVTNPTYGSWSEWTVDNEDDSQLVRTRPITYYDSVETEYVCDTDTGKESMDRPLMCKWDEGLEADDPECPVDCEYDSTISSRDPLCAPEDNEGEVLGATDDNSKDTGVVLAATGPTDNIVVYIVELLLVAILVTYSVFFTKTYLKNSK